MAKGELKFDDAKAKRIFKSVRGYLLIGLFLLFCRKNSPLNALIFAFLTLWTVWSLLSATSLALIAMREARKDAK